MNKHQEIIDLDDDDDEGNINKSFSIENKIYQHTEEDLYIEHDSTPLKEISKSTTTSTSSNVFNFDSDIQTPQKVALKKQAKKNKPQQKVITKKSPQKQQQVHSVDSGSDSDSDSGSGSDLEDSNSNNIAISDTPVKNIKRKNEEIDKFNEKNTKKKSQKLDSSNNSTKQYVDKDLNSKKPTPPHKGSAITIATTTTARVRTNKFSQEQTQSFLEKGTFPEEEEVAEEEKEDTSESASEEISSETASYSSSSSYSFTSSSSTSNGRKSRKEKKEKITEKSLKKEAFISFDKSFKEISNHSKDFIEPLKDFDIENIEYRDNSIDYSIKFIRKKENQAIITEKFIIIFIPVEVFVDLIMDNQAIDYIKSIKDKNSDANYTLLIEGLDRHLKRRARETKDKLQKNLLEKSSLINMKSVPERTTINKLFIDIQLTFGFTIKTIEERADVISVLAKFYDLIVKRPLKSETPLFKGFCVESIKKRSKDISFTDIWINQLCQISGVSSNIARSIVNVYPTISSLYKKFNSLSTQREKELALKDIMLETVSGQRKLGEILSTRIYNIFASTDPKKIVNM